MAESKASASFKIRNLRLQAASLQAEGNTKEANEVLKEIQRLQKLLK
jgi:hypothetical protein